MEEKTRNHASCFVHEPFNWMHGNSTPRLEVATLMMEIVHILIHPFSNIGKPSCIPLVLKSMDPVKVSISPNGKCKKQGEESKWVFWDVQEVVGQVTSCIKWHKESLNEGSHNNCANWIWNFAPNMFLMWIVFVEFDFSECYCICRVVKQDLPEKWCCKWNNEISCCDFEYPVEVTQILITLLILFNWCFCIRHLLFDGVRLICQPAH